MKKEPLNSQDFQIIKESLNNSVSDIITKMANITSIQIDSSKSIYDELEKDYSKLEQDLLKIKTTLEKLF